MVMNTVGGRSENLSGESNSDEAKETVLTLARGMQRGALVPALLVAVLAVALGFVLRGSAGGIGVVVGAGIALGSCILGLVVMRLTAGSHPMVAMAGATAGFVGKIIVALGLLLLLRGIDGFDSTAAGIGMLVVVLTWTVGEVIGFTRARAVTIASAKA